MEYLILNCHELGHYLSRKKYEGYKFFILKCMIDIY
jgi:hypothetical protein